MLSPELITVDILSEPMLSFLKTFEKKEPHLSTRNGHHNFWKTHRETENQVVHFTTP